MNTISFLSFFSVALAIGQYEGHHESGGVCDIAPDQSPINIIPSQAIHDEEQCDSELDWYINRHHSSFIIKDTCQKNHTVQVIATNDDGNLISHARETIAVLNTEHLPEVMRKHESYCLDQFHIHWGSVDNEGSEHQINGHASALEMHFVHYACEYDTFAAAQAEGAATGGSGSADHTLAVVALFFEFSEYDNPAFDLILEHVGGECKDTHGGEVCDHQLLQFLLPTGWETGGYFAYQGGLTTTPCTDDVNWILLNTKATISSNQLEQLRALKHPFTGEEITANFREIVENDKPVYTCMDGDIDEEFEEVSGLSFDVDTDGDIATLITDDDTTSSTSSSSSASTDEDTTDESIQSERELIFEMLTGMRANGNSEAMIRRLQSSSSSASASSSSSSESSDESSASSSSVSSVDEPVRQNSRTIGEIVSSHPNLSIFETALRASNWNVLLEEPGTLTVFAPSNDAFINAGYTEEILLQTSNLENLISYHIFSSYSSWFDYEKLQNSPGLFIKAANDQTIAVLVYGNTNDVSLLDINGNRAHIIDPDLMATNGMVHIIDNVLIG